MQFKIMLATLFSMAAASAAQAQGAPACELHFWPSDVALTSNYSGVGGVAGALLSGPRPRTGEALTTDLPPSAQAEALARLPLADLLNMPGVRLVTEQGPYTGKAGKKGPRLSGSTVPCYAELVVDYFGYTSHITAGRKFGARFWLRTYPGGAATATVQNGGKDVGLKIYPAKKPENQAAGLAELQAAFGETAARFLRSKIR